MGKGLNMWTVQPVKGGKFLVVYLFNQIKVYQSVPMSQDEAVSFIKLARAYQSE